MKEFQARTFFSSSHFISKGQESKIQANANNQGPGAPEYFSVIFRHKARMEVTHVQLLAYSTQYHYGSVYTALSDVTAACVDIPDLVLI